MGTVFTVRTRRRDGDASGGAPVFAWKVHILCTNSRVVQETVDSVFIGYHYIRRNLRTRRPARPVYAVNVYLKLSYLTHMARLFYPIFIPWLKPEAEGGVITK